MIVLIVLVACRLAVSTATLALLAAQTRSGRRLKATFRRLDPEACRPLAGAGAIRPPASGPLTPGRRTV